MKTTLTQSQRLTALLALLDDVIEKDEGRTQGVWENTIDTEYPFHELWNSGQKQHLGSTIREEDASFIASASVSHGRNARELKDDLLVWGQLAVHRDAYAQEKAKTRIAEIVAIYPDEILTRYLK